jgi:hypothetical protein
MTFTAAVLHVSRPQRDSAYRSTRGAKACAELRIKLDPTRPNVNEATGGFQVARGSVFRRRRHPTHPTNCEGVGVLLRVAYP